MTSKQLRDQVMIMLDPTLYNDPVMRANLGMNILKEDKSSTSNIFGAALVTAAFRDMNGIGGRR